MYNYEWGNDEYYVQNYKYYAYYRYYGNYICDCFGHGLSPLFFCSIP